jgi:Ca2+-binding RTX toxin-like protein
VPIQADLVASGLAAPTFAASAPGVADQLFITEKDSGRVVVLDLTTNQVSAQAFFDVPAAEMSFAGEGGLLGLAFHPDYATNGKVYLYLTNEAGDSELWEITRSASDPSIADPASARVLMTVGRTATNHVGGWIGFGPDGFLYIASGDSGGSGDPENAAQNVNDLRGKMLRIDVNGDAFPADAGRDYAIPAGNPFVGIQGADEVFAYGLRNPWRASFDRATGDLYIADVGQAAREEIDFLAAGTGAGTNFGWRVLEGTLPTGYPQLDNPPANDPSLTAPIHEYGRGEGGSIIGGYVYRGPGSAQGEYFFADFLSDHLWTARVVDGEVVQVVQRDAELILVNGGTLDMMVSFAEDGQGRLYVIGLDGELFRLTPIAQADPVGTYEFSALSDGQAISFSLGPTPEVLNFDQTAIAAADIRPVAEGSNVRISVVAGPHAGKDVLLLGVSPLQLATTNVTFADGSQLLIGDNSTALNDDAANTLSGTSGRDLLLGFGGNDIFVGGGGGADVIDGGEGRDSIEFKAAGTSAIVVDYIAGTITGGGPGTISLASIERVVGGNFNDSMSGNAAAQTLTGQGGTDTLWGAGGVDTLWGGTGGDTFLFRETGTANADRVSDFASGVDKIALDGVVMGALGAAGNFAPGDARFWAAAGATGGHDADDRVVYNTTTRQLFYDADGSAGGAAQLIATLQTGASLSATDIAVDKSGTAPINGTDANDSIVGTAGNDTIIGNGGNDTLQGSSGNDRLDGGLGDDSLRGAEGADTFIGGDGYDTLDGDNAGTFETDVDAERLEGGFGNDTYIVDNVDDVLSDDGGTDTVIAVNINWTLAPGFDNLVLQNENDSAVQGIGNELANVLGSPNQGRFVSFEGRGGNDTIFGSAQNDTLLGGDGNDSIDSGADFDIVDAGAGNDTLRGGFGGGDSLTGGAGADHFVIDGDHNSIADFASGVDKLELDGSRLAGTGLSGNFAVGDERFYAAPGATAAHDATDRVVYNTTTGDVHYDPDGAGGIAATLFATLPALSATDITVINGDITGVVINGTAGNDSLAGTPADDRVSGLDGDDTLDGQAGNDTLVGGDHSDTFLFTVSPGTANADSIADFNTGVDKVVLDGTVHLNAGPSGNFAAADLRFHSHAGANIAHDANQHVLYDTATGELWYDADGSGAAAVQLVATLQGAPSLAATDIAVVNGTTPSGEVINGTSGNDTLAGTDGNDTINGLGGNDLFLAGGSGGADMTDGGAGFDSIEFKERATSGVVVDFAAGTITGGGPGTISFTNVERVVGGNFNDQMTGNNAGQTLTGQGGADTLWGAGGIDTLWGGGGADTFIFRETGSANADSVRDWASGTDKVALDDAAMSALGARGNFSAGDARFAAGAGFTLGRDASDRVVYNTSTGSLYYDADGSGAGAAQLIATFAGNPAVAAIDIVVI